MDSKVRPFSNSVHYALLMILIRQPAYKVLWGNC